MNFVHSRPKKTKSSPHCTVDRRIVRWIAASYGGSPHRTVDHCAVDPSWKYFLSKVTGPQEYGPELLRKMGSSRIIPASQVVKGSSIHEPADHPTIFKLLAAENSIQHKNPRSKIQGWIFQ